ncbi:hypothetical protein H2200_008456 [Cladophialophora chaetospira]|uniref:Erythromycin esterase n=1 Tax=Cladophialophora chaetospira TaxID=386627 RepID=A0AA38X5T3_9EURO|nr:hypothetical protein H2200_008456 [Cladophialophora chaetospira]
MAVPRRRSARLSATQQQRASPRKPASVLQLESLVERDESPVDEPQSIDNVLNTPASTATNPQLSRLSVLKTPKTEPRPDRGEMHPQLLHQSTAKAPDSGLKLGFVDPPANLPKTVASAQNTPSRTHSSNTQLSSATFDFNFGSESALSNAAQQMMDTVREEAARIKVQMQMERDAQKQKDAEAEAIFGGVNAAGRKIAKPKGKAGRFSDIHMAQFKKMDSIANHPSALRAKQPGFAQPTTQSLKRSGSKAGLDEIDRPRTAGKGTPGRKPPPFLGRPTSVSPFKSIPAAPERIEKPSQDKRARHSEFQDVSSNRPSEQESLTRPTTFPRPVSSRLLSPTKASLARAATSQIPIASPGKTPALTRTTSSRSLRPTPAATSSARPATSHGLVSASSKIPQFAGSLERPLPPLPKEALPSPYIQYEEPPKPVPSLPASTASSSFASRLPKLSSLKSILRSPRKTDVSSPAKDASTTPRRPNTAMTDSANGSLKKVDFTPSVKSRYAVKLAAGSPSPARLPTQLTPGNALAPAVLYDPAAYTIDDEDGWEDAEDASSEVDYPALPDPSSSPVAPPKVDTAFVTKAKEYGRRESKEFKSIFTTLHHPSRTSAPSSLTSVNTTVNKTDPTVNANKVMRSPSSTNFSQPSPSTIRRVRTSGVTSVVQPFEDADVKTMPHGLPGKKRRRASEDQQSTTDSESGKENRRMSIMPSVPGGWRDSPVLGHEEQDEGEKRGGKRMRTAPPAEKSPEKTVTASPAKKARPSSAREMAKQNAKDRKGGRSTLMLSRLNFLSQPKQRD